MGRRWNPTPEERAERKERDRKVLAAADAILSTPQGVEQLIDRLMRAKVGPRVLKYSLRNQALVFAQCEERGIPLTDVAGRKTWNSLGRRVRGPGLRITARNGRDEGPDVQSVSDDPKQQAEQGGKAGEDGEEKLGFHMISVWDLSMTEPRFESDDPPAAEPAPEDPARMMLDTLIGQLDRRGYTVVEDGPGDPERASNIDHDAKVIALSEWWTVRDRIVTIALGLSQLITAEAQRRAERAAEKAVSVGAGQS